MAAKLMTPVVVDLSHHNEVEDFGKVYASGVRGVIHKATQGGSFVDGDYSARRAAAQAAGLLWGAYHFADNSDVERQVENFLSAIGDPTGMVLALDFEPNGSKTMTLAQAKKWLQLVYQRTGQRPILYSGNLLKECLGKKADPFFSSHRLWLAQYGPKAVLPPGFASYWLWQYSGDGVNGVGIVPGISTKGIDCNVFGGSDIAAEWGHYPDAAAPTPVAGREDATLADLKGQSRKVDALIAAKNVGAGASVTSTTIGAVSEVLNPVHVQIPDALLSVDSLGKISEGAGHAKAIVETGKGIFSDLLPALITVWDAFLPVLKACAALIVMLAQVAMLNGWIIGTILGIAIFVVADRLLGWHLEDYVFGRWQPSRAG